MKKKMTLHDLFANNKFVLVFSFVLAFIIWIAVVMVFSPETQRVIEDVPVRINLENSVPEKFDLQLFGETEFTVDVTVTGKRYVVNAKNVNVDSIEVVAQTGYVDSAGRKQLQLKATLVDNTADYEIEAISDEYIEVYFDEYKEATFPLEVKVEYDKGSYIPEGYIEEAPLITIDSETITEVKITGAAQQINSISKVYALVELEKQLTETAVFEAEVIPTDQFGMSLKYIQINGEDAPTASVTIPVLKTETLPTDIIFSNVPTAYTSKPLSFSITPSNVKVAMLESTLKNIDTLVLDEVDFSLMSDSVNTFTFDKSVIENTNLKILDDIESFTVKIDASSMSSKTLNVSGDAISVINNKTDKTLSFGSNSLKVRVIGPQATLEKMTGKDVAAEVNLNNITLSNGENTVPVKLSIKNTVDCWVYGTYTTTITAR